MLERSLNAYNYTHDHMNQFSNHQIWLNINVINKYYGNKTYWYPYIRNSKNNNNNLLTKTENIYILVFTCIFVWCRVQ